MAEHRVPLLRRYEDPEHSSDPKIRQLVTALQTLDVAPPPRAHFRAELRAQLVAVAPRIIAESADERAAAMVDIVPRPSAAQARAAAEARVQQPSFLQRLRAVPIGRPLMVAASVVTVLAFVLGGAVWMSQKALPGDALYGLKRASENFEISTASSDSERAQDYLDFAGRRVDEAKALVGRSTASGSGLSAAGISPHTAGLIDSTLGSADSDVLAAARLLGKQAVRDNSGKPLDSMTDFAPGQLAKLNALAAALPAGALRSRAQSSSSLVQQALTRAKALQSSVNCNCLGTAPHDSLGPLPCSATCSVTPAPGKPRPAPSTGTGGQSRPGGGVTGGGTGTTVTVNPGGGSSSSPGVPGLPLPTSGLPLPGLSSLPIPIPTSPPVSIGKSCVSASLIIGITLGSCPSK